MNDGQQFVLLSGERGRDVVNIEDLAEGPLEAVYLTAQADLSAAVSLPTRLEKGWYVYRQLTSIAARTQPAVISELKKLGVDYHPYWIANMIWVRANLNAIQVLVDHRDQRVTGDHEQQRRQRHHARRFPHGPADDAAACQRYSLRLARRRLLDRVGGHAHARSHVQRVEARHRDQAQHPADVPD